MLGDRAKNSTLRTFSCVVSQYVLTISIPNLTPVGCALWVGHPFPINIAEGMHLSLPAVAREILQTG